MSRRHHLFQSGGWCARCSSPGEKSHSQLPRLVSGDGHCDEGWIRKWQPQFSTISLQEGTEQSVQSGCLLSKLILRQLQAGHSGIVRMKEIARSYFWWPGVDREIESTTKTCSSCHKVKNALRSLERFLAVLVLPSSWSLIMEPWCHKKWLHSCKQMASNTVPPCD